MKKIAVIVFIMLFSLCTIKCNMSKKNVNKTKNKNNIEIGISLVLNLMTQNYQLLCKNVIVDTNSCNYSKEYLSRQHAIGVFNVVYENCKYFVAYSDTCRSDNCKYFLISHIHTCDSNYYSSEGCYIGMNLREARCKTKNKPRLLLHNWGEVTLLLEDNWEAYFIIENIKETSKQDTILYSFVKIRQYKRRKNLFWRLRNI